MTMILTQTEDTEAGHIKVLKALEGLSNSSKEKNDKRLAEYLKAKAGPLPDPTSPSE
jgi:hypothetical protein